MGIFLNYQGVQGESADAGHKGWIDVKAWEWGGERQITSATSIPVASEIIAAAIYTTVIWTSRN